jgi:hypothetical protein
MTKDQLTTDKLDRIDRISHFITILAREASMIENPIPVNSAPILSGKPLELYSGIIEQFGFYSLYETYRAILYAALQQKLNEQREALINEINNN